MIKKLLQDIKWYFIGIWLYINIDRKSIEELEDDEIQINNSNSL